MDEVLNPKVRANNILSFEMAIVNDEFLLWYDYAYTLSAKYLDKMMEERCLKPREFCKALANKSERRYALPVFTLKRCRFTLVVLNRDWRKCYGILILLKMHSV